MVQFLEARAAEDTDDPDDELDLVFAALADRTRRHVLRTLGASEGEMSVGELAQPHGMSLTGFMKHLRVLEAAGLVQRTKEGRVVRCALGPAPLQEAAVWLSRYEKFWSERFDALGRYLQQRQETARWPSRKPDAPPTGKRPRSASSAAIRRPSTKSGGPGPSRKR